MTHPQAAGSRRVLASIPQMKALARAYGVERLELFGSVMTPDYDPLVSDVDLLVTYPADYDMGPWLGKHQALRDDIVDLLGTRVDLVMSSALRDEGFRDEAATTRQVIYDADEDEEVAQ